MNQLDIAYKFVEEMVLKYTGQPDIQQKAVTKLLEKKVPGEMKVRSETFMIKEEKEFSGNMKLSYIEILSTSEFMRYDLKNKFLSINFNGPIRNELKEQYEAFKIQYEREQQLDKIL